jgi:hypothetical protein
MQPDILIAQTPTFVSVKHERRDGLTESMGQCRASRSLRYVALRSVIALSIWPYHRLQNHLNYENLGFSPILSRVATWSQLGMTERGGRGEILMCAGKKTHAPRKQATPFVCLFVCLFVCSLILILISRRHGCCHGCSRAAFSKGDSYEGQCKCKLSKRSIPVRMEWSHPSLFLVVLLAFATSHTIYSS